MLIVGASTRAILLLTLLAGCAADPVAPDPVAEAAAIAREVEAAPDRATEILAAHGTTTEQFEALMFEIAADPEKSAAFEAARR